MHSHIISSDFTPTHVPSLTLPFVFSRTSSVCLAISRCYFTPLPAVLSQLLHLFCSVRLSPKTILVAAFCDPPSGSVWACIPQRTVASAHSDRIWPAWMPSWFKMALLLCKAKAWMQTSTICSCNHFLAADWMFSSFLREIITIESYGIGH